MDPATQASSPPPEKPTDGELDLTGRTLADFHVLRQLGHGGMGQVYLAEQISLRRKVALKILRPELAADPTSLQRFKAEATAVARATHANIVQVYAIGEAGGLAYMALEYVEGQNLREQLLKKGPPDLLLALSIMRQVAAALQRAGELGMIHRDIKPENILLTRKGEVKVADFGLARCLAGDRPAVNLTQSGVTMGTPLYMSPEQVEGKPVDCRSDIYSFGVTCYHMLAGHPPFAGDSPFEVALQHVRTEPKALAEVRPDLPAALCAVIHKMLAKDPAGRHQTGRELLHDVARLRETLSGQTGVLALVEPSETVSPAPPPSGTAAVPPAPSTQVLKPSRRRGWWVAAFLASVLLAAVAGAAVAWSRHRLDFPLHGAAVPASDDDKSVLPDGTEEAALRTVVEPYLTKRPEDRFENQVGLGLCMKMGIFYLERDRLDDALALFARLEKHPVPAYKLLGHVGHAIVLALQNRAQESNDRLRDITRRPPVKPRVENQQWQWMWQDEKWRYWMRKALHYNQQNGIKPDEIPQVLHKLL